VERSDFDRMNRIDRIEKNIPSILFILSKRVPLV
jgi:hypothetical protein